jgi:hypothetical protein
VQHEVHAVVVVAAVGVVHPERPIADQAGDLMAGELPSVAVDRSNALKFS